MLGNAVLRETIAANAAITAQNYLPERILARWDDVVQSVIGRDISKT